MRFIREKVYRFFVVITALVSAHVSLAQDITQNPTVQAALSSTLEHVSMGTTRVPTGYLLDRAFEVADLRSFSGDSLSVYNYADVGVFRNCLLTINSSRVNTNGAEIDGNAAVNAMQDSTAVLLSAAVFQYNYIVANAVTDNLITLIGGKLYDKRKNGVLQNPFSSAYMFVMSPGVIAHTGTSVHYKFSTSRLYGNCTVQSIQFDAGDGNGYVTLTNNSYDNTVNYSAVGTKELKMRVTLSGGKVLLGHALIEIEDYVSSPSGTATSPDHEFIVSLPSDTSVKAKVSYKYAPNHSGIIKPFVFVEGFDVFGGSSGYGNLDFPWFYDSVLTNDTFKNEYDIVYVDWANPTADITHNAELLKIILSSINTNKHNNNSQEKNIIVGHSMGGLVARYALRTMELGNIPHETKCYVSYDSPHLGVNVPLGLQYTVRDAHWLLSGSGGNVGLVQLIAYNILSDLVAIYESPSAKQMMYYYVDSSGNLLTTYHDSWQQMLDSIGFPEGDPGTDIENLSIVNGAPYENLSSHFADVSFWYNVFDFSQLLNLWFPFISVGNVSATFNIERNQGNGCVVSSSQATYYKTHLFGLTEDCSLFGANGRIHYAPSGSVGYDIIPSSYLPTGSFSDFSFAGFSAQIQDTVAFVPAASKIPVSHHVLTC